MKTSLILILILAAVSMLVAACDTPGQKAWVEISCDEFSENNHINAMLEVQVGETFEVKLCSNPSTGFQWSEKAEINDQTILQQKDHEFIGPESEPPPPPGTPGQEVWAFEALKQGSSDIYLEYGQPWDGGEEEEWTCTVNVVVRTASEPLPEPEKINDKQETLILEDTTWVLELYGEKGKLQTLLEDTEITVEFKSDEGKCSGSSGCNGYFAGYEVNDSELTIILPIGSTLMSCPDPIMAQEQEYLELLKTLESFQIQNGKLTISCSGNGILVFITQ